MAVWLTGDQRAATTVQAIADAEFRLRMISRVLIDAGVIPPEYEFSLACLAGLHNDRCAVNGKVRKLLQRKHRTRLLASWELLHRLFLMVKAISYFWSGKRKEFKDTVFGTILDADLHRFCQAHKAAVTTLLRRFGCKNSAGKVLQIRWLERINTNRFSTLTGGAWVLRRSIQSQPVWALVQRICRAAPELAGKRFASLAAELGDPVVQDKLRVLECIFLKVDMPWTRKAYKLVSLGGVRPLVVRFRDALRSLLGDSKSARALRLRFLDAGDQRDVLGEAVRQPVPRHRRRRRAGVYAEQQAGRRRRVALALEKV
eukprot:gene4247-2385_t